MPTVEEEKKETEMSSSDKGAKGVVVGTSGIMSMIRRKSSRKMTINRRPTPKELALDDTDEEIVEKPDADEDDEDALQFGENWDSLF